MLSLAQLGLILEIIGYSLHAISDTAHRAIRAKLHRLRYPRRPLPAPASPDPRPTVLVIGASFAGYHAAKLLATALPPTHRVVVVEPCSHFHFTWALPRYAVVPGHEAHAFIPYGGCGAAARLMGGVEEKGEGVEVLRASQEKVRQAGRIVVVGGGAVGVEVAADAKSEYPEKSITLVHSREEVIGQFGKRLKDAARKGLEDLGVEVVLGERVVEREEGVVVLRSGRRVECDFLIGSTGQKPVSGIVADLSPSSVAESGHIRVKPTMQIADDSLPNVYIAGEVAKTDVRNVNARSAMEQATVAADNILLAVKGKEPQVHYKSSWIDDSILLTLGLKKDVMYISDSGTELLFNLKSKGPSMNAAAAWRHMGAKPFADSEEVETKAAY
ncbi:hypothetical protein GTA08_BOTSDO08145 [Botryosphaeria dothidea]|uniref:FAD/NAD(P)-binding domain-containing protein n=1 Tax=Botryosphaeria dothidea TaxID=55169 RepID=A0A8H4N5I3_9PEZI|nr:hypothetical protein GTA08_BOTSDO08145 [Botryosphaeria dothidea]